MVRFSRYYYNVYRPLGPGGKPATLCAGHRKLSRDIAVEGTVLLKNTGLLPLAPGPRTSADPFSFLRAEGLCLL